MMLAKYAAEAVMLWTWLTMLVVFQICYSAQSTTYPLLTVESALKHGLRGLTLDRHYAIALDIAIMSSLAALGYFLHRSQWTLGEAAKAFSMGLVLTGLAVAVWASAKTPEAHKDLWVGGTHAIYAWVIVSIIIMILVYAERPNPTFLLVLCCAAPAFLFLGNHMYLGLINMFGDATSYPDNPLKNPVGWGITLGVTGLFAWYAWKYIPADYWAELVRS